MEMQVTFKEKFYFNTTLRLKCKAGFKLADMDESYRICQENQTWSGLEPTCTGKYLCHVRRKCVFGVYAVSKEPQQPVRSDTLA